MAEGKPAKVLRRGRVGAVRLTFRQLHDRLARIGVVGRVDVQRLLQRVTVRVAQPMRDLVHLGLDPAQVLQAEGMNLLGGGRDGGLHADREPIQLLPIRHGPDAWLGHGVRLVLVGQEVAQVLQGGLDVLIDRGGHLGPRVVVGDVGQRHGRELVGRRCGQALDLLDLLAHRDGGSGAAVGDPFAQGVDVLVDCCRVGGEPGEELLQPFRRLGDLVLGHHHRHGLHARDVVDRQLVELLLLRLQLVARDQDQHVAGDDLLRLEAGGVDRLDLRQQGPIYPRLLCAALRAEVRQAVVEAVVAQDGGEDRLTLEHALEETVGDLVDGGVGCGVSHGRTVLPGLDRRSRGIGCVRGKSYPACEALERWTRV